MNELKQTPKEFFKILTQYTGKPVYKLEQIIHWKIHGTELYDLCKFYFSCVYTRYTSEELRRKDNTIYRLKGIIVFLLIIITLLIIK
jgi:hypothetical protein